MKVCSASTLRQFLQAETERPSHPPPSALCSLPKAEEGPGPLVPACPVIKPRCETMDGEFSSLLSFGNTTARSDPEEKEDGGLGG